MKTIPGLHLQYRLWIADMNANIDVLRILNDYVEDKIAADKSEATMQRIQHFKNVFVNLRSEMDELRHEMHLNKMQLGALPKNTKQSVNAIKKTIHHKTLQQRYTLFKKSFLKIKKEFQDFEK